MQIDAGIECVRLTVEAHVILRGDRSDIQAFHLTGAANLLRAAGSRCSSPGKLALSLVCSKRVTVDVKGLTNDRWAETVLDFTSADSSGLGKGDRVDAIQFLLPRGAELVIDDLLLYEPER